jgi:hypothetical protein
MLLTPHIAKAIVEHRDGYKVSERKRKSIVTMNDDKSSFALLRAAQTVEKAKDYEKELGNLHYVIGMFDNLLTFIFPLKDSHSLIMLAEPSIIDLKTFVSDVKEVITKNSLGI